VRHSPRKRFGQNFLQSQAIIAKIIQAIHPSPDDNMLEIGPGLGALTFPLLKCVNHLKAVEIDTDLQQFLTESEQAKHCLEIIPADALTLDYNAFGTDLRVVGNLPYNISTPILLHLLYYIDSIADMHFMLQKEVVCRMAAEPGTKAYGRLSVMLQYYCEVEYLFDVPPEAFSPQPKVDSAIVRLTPFHKSPYENVARESLEKIVAIAFAMRRKTLANNLKKVVSVVELDKLGIDASKRPEQITVAEYVQLAKFVSN
jgi:16S rRNA (adenine1518-N6/adenine1519-N6)-dimethyltransferase